MKKEKILEEIRNSIVKREEKYEEANMPPRNRNGEYEISPCKLQRKNRLQKYTLIVTALRASQQ